MRTVLYNDVFHQRLTEADEGEGHDRASLELPPAQMVLAAAVAKVQPRTIIVLINGGAIAVEALISGDHPVPGKCFIN